MIKVLVVDDHLAVRRALSGRLKIERDFQIVEEGINAFDGIRLALQHNPVVIVMDYQMSGMDGIEATRVLKQLCPRCPVIILSLQNSGQLLQLATEAGAFAWVGKHEPVEHLIEVIHKANEDLHKQN